MVRVVNAGLKTHVPSIVGLSLALVADDGNRAPGAPKLQSEILMPAGKTRDVLVTPASTGADAERVHGSRVRVLRPFARPVDERPAVRRRARLPRGRQSRDGRRRGHAHREPGVRRVARRRRGQGRGRDRTGPRRRLHGSRPSQDLHEQRARERRRRVRRGGHGPADERHRRHERERHVHLYLHRRDAAGREQPPSTASRIAATARPRARCARK